MMFRNLMSIDVEEMIRAQPMDAVVLIGGCDKTVPAQLMGAASADLPAVQLLAGPMMPTSFHGERLGACTDCRRFWALHRAGKVDAAEIETSRRQPRHHRRHLRGDGHGLDHGLHRRGARHGAAGHAPRFPRCMPTGCAPPRRAARAPSSWPRSPIRPSADHHREIGRERAARAARDRRLDQRHHPSHRDRRPRRHARSTCKRLNELSDSTPVLVDLKPTGQHYMSDLYAAGGVGAVLRELKPLLHLDCMTVAGVTLGERARSASRRGSTARWCKPFDEPLSQGGRPGRAVRLARAERRHPQALGRRSEALRAAKAARWCSPRSTTSRRASTIRRSTSRPTISSCCRTPARSPATPCRKRATCRSRRSSRAPA